MGGYAVAVHSHRFPHDYRAFTRPVSFSRFLHSLQHDRDRAQFADRRRDHRFAFSAFDRDWAIAMDRVFFFGLSDRRRADRVRGPAKPVQRSRVSRCRPVTDGAAADSR